MSLPARISTYALIRRMESAGEDQNLDDETFELEQRLSAQGKTFRWTDLRGKQRLEIVKKETKA